MSSHITMQLSDINSSHYKMDLPLKNNAYLQRILSDDKPVKISTIKSYIEADEAVSLLEIIENNNKAKIYCLILCFTFIPSIKCIELLIAKGTPLNKTFENNPFNCTPQEYLDAHFNNTSNKIYTKARNAIYQAIEKGKQMLENKDTLKADLTAPSSITFKKVSKIFLMRISRTTR